MQSPRDEFKKWCDKHRCIDCELAEEHIDISYCLARWCYNKGQQDKEVEMEKIQNAKRHDYIVKDIKAKQVYEGLTSEEAHEITGCAPSNFNKYLEIPYKGRYLIDKGDLYRKSNNDIPSAVWERWEACMVQTRKALATNDWNRKRRALSELQPGWRAQLNG